MTDTRILQENGDVLVLLVAFAGLSAVGTTYSGTARLFPLVFLVAGTIFLVAELVVILAPEPYHTPLRRLTMGLAADMDTDQDAAPSTSETEDDTWSKSQRLAITFGLFVVIILVTYLFGFLVAVIPITVGSALVFGRRNWRIIVITTVILLIGVQTLFGTLLSVPTLEGTVIDWTELW